jgi:hypothetical protein
MLKTSTLDDGLVFVIDVDPTAEWHHSTFPEPLITIDRDGNDAVIKIVAVGGAARELTSATAAVLQKLVQNAEVATELEAALA